MAASTFCCCASDTSGPICVSSLSGSPTRMRAAAPATRETTSSAMPSWTSNRLVAEHTCQTRTAGENAKEAATAQGGARAAALRAWPAL
jgi:hypothetical protein